MKTTIRQNIRILQINAGLSYSTGKITQQIGEKALENGFESWIAYTPRDSTSESKSNTITVGSRMDPYIHYLGHRLFDMEGQCSSKATRLLVEKIKQISPDIILLHNIHDHWLNIKILFECFATLDVPIIWVQHDCWAFTGGCMYFDMIHCNKWKVGCATCPDKRSLFNRAEKNLSLKRDLISMINNIVFVPVSDWLGESLRLSIISNRPIITIHNGVDINIFKPYKMMSKETRKFDIIGVAAVWDARKGLNDFLKLRSILPLDDYSITLVGLKKKQIQSLPPGIEGIERTQSAEELAKLYSKADVFINPTYSDNFPTTNIEALACGTPVITYKTGGSPETIDEKTGRVVEQGNIKELVRTIFLLREKPLSSEICRQRAVELFDKDKCFDKYIELFNVLLNKTI